MKHVMTTVTVVCILGPFAHVDGGSIDARCKIPGSPRSRRVCLQLLSCKRLRYMVSLTNERKERSEKGALLELKILKTTIRALRVGQEKSEK